jgi:hypothetical protein
MNNSVCMGYDFMNGNPCEQYNVDQCGAVPGCKVYSTTPPPSLQFLNADGICLSGNDCKSTSGKKMISNPAPDEELYKYMLINKQLIQNIVPVSYSSNSWPCRGQSDTCNYFYKNPIIPTYVKEIDLASLPPNA